MEPSSPALTRRQPQATIFADANGGWSVAEAARLIPLLARRGLKFIEQPVHHQEARLVSRRKHPRPAAAYDGSSRR